MTGGNFSDLIEAHKAAERVLGDSEETSTEAGAHLSVRLRGCFVTDFTALGENGEPVRILYSDPDTEIPKLTASHIMAPAGPYDGIGGQHGFARWADYAAFPQQNEHILAFQAKRPDLGMGVKKLFALGNRSLTTTTTLTNNEDEPINTSIGEHLYFDLPDASSDGLLLNDRTLDELFGEGTEASIMSGKAFFWKGFPGHAIIDFPAGHTILMLATTGDAELSAPMGMLIWHKPDSPSICFEPTLGFSSGEDNQRLRVPPRGEASLITQLQVK